VRTLALVDLPALTGAELGVSGWVTVDQAMIDAFATLTRDRQWIHVDVARAGREADGTIAHGFLVLSLIGGMTGEIAVFAGARMGLNYGFDRIRFLTPVRAGASVRLRETVVSVEARGDGVLLRRECRIELEGSDRPAVIADWLTLFYPV